MQSVTFRNVAYVLTSISVSVYKNHKNTSRFVSDFVVSLTYRQKELFNYRRSHQTNDDIVGTCRQTQGLQRFVFLKRNVKHCRRTAWNGARSETFQPESLVHVVADNARCERNAVRARSVDAERLAVDIDSCSIGAQLSGLRSSSSWLVPSAYSTVTSPLR